MGEEVTTDLYKEVFAVYHELVDQLYYAGARNFVFLNVPLLVRAPWTLVQGGKAEVAEKAAFLTWDASLADMMKNFKEEKHSANFLSAWDLFTEVLDDPVSFSATEKYRGDTGRAHHIVMRMRSKMPRRSRE